MQPREAPARYASAVHREILLRLAGLEPVHRHFFLTGGTALAVFYLHHRISEDLDLFSADEVDLGGVHEILKRNLGKDVVLIQASPRFYSYLIRGVKVDVVHDPLSSVIERPLVDLSDGQAIRVDPLEEIAANKLCAAVSRFEPKDAVDLYALHGQAWADRQDEAFEACLALARTKEALLDDPAAAGYQIEQLRRRIEVLGDEALRPLSTPVTSAALGAFLEALARRLYAKQAW